MMKQPPRFITHSQLLRSAYEFASAAHHGPAREGDTDIDHPVEVATLLYEEGFGEQVIAAALLHDVVEDTALDLPTITEQFGPAISRLVAEMTEDSSIEDYPRRKAEHRGRVTRDRRAAAIYAADKLATMRGLTNADEVSEEKLGHYMQTLRVLSGAHPDLPFLGELRDELSAVAT